MRHVDYFVDRMGIDQCARLDFDGAVIPDDSAALAACQLVDALRTSGHDDEAVANHASQLAACARPTWR